MSKYLTYNQICFKNRQRLVEALADVGYPHVEVGENLHLIGYGGDTRPETADVVVRRKYIGSASNDLGFTKTEGGYVPVISSYDGRGRLGEKFQADLKTAYAERSIKAAADRLHGVVKRDQVGNTIKIKLRY